MGNRQTPAEKYVNDGGDFVAEAINGRWITKSVSKPNEHCNQYAWFQFVTELLIESTPPRSCTKTVTIHKKTTPDGAPSIVYQTWSLKSEEFENVLICGADRLVVKDFRWEALCLFDPLHQITVMFGLQREISPVTVAALSSSLFAGFDIGPADIDESAISDDAVDSLERHMRNSDRHINQWFFQVNVANMPIWHKNESIEEFVNHANICLLCMKRLPRCYLVPCGCLRCYHCIESRSEFDCSTCGCKTDCLGGPLRFSNIRYYPQEWSPAMHRYANTRFRQQIETLMLTRASQQTVVSDDTLLYDIPPEAMMLIYEALYTAQLGLFGAL